MEPRQKATRHVARRDGGLEGEVDPEATAPDEAREKERQRDLTSLSGPGPRKQRR